jgi:putative phosphoesterase
VRVAALSDIHGNLPALEAVLADVEREDVDAIVVAGDTFSGPWPAEVVDLLAGVDPVIVRGNADRPDAIRDFDDALGAWNEERLGSRRLATVAQWPLTAELEITGLGSVLVCHSTPHDDEPIYTRITPNGELVELLRPVDHDVLVCGHTHMQYDRMLPTGLRVVNPGSVGMPYEGRRGAFWAVLGPDVDFRHSDYDVEAAVAAIELMAAPVGAEHLRHLLDPPTSDETTAYFESLRGT